MPYLAHFSSLATSLHQVHRLCGLEYTHDPEKQGYFMAGLPMSSAIGHIATLVAAGHKVGSRRTGPGVGPGGV